MLTKRVFFILFLFVMVMGLVSAVGASDSVGDIMTNGTVDEIGIYDNIETGDLKSDDVLESSDDGTFTALQNKINDAKEGSTINLENDYHFNLNFNSVNGVKIDKSLTINGNGHVIDGFGISSLLRVNGAKNIILNINLMSFN